MVATGGLTVYLPLWYTCTSILGDDSFCNLSPNVVVACLLQPSFADFSVKCCVKKGFHDDSILKMRSRKRCVLFAVSLAFGYLDYISLAFESTLTSFYQVFSTFSSIGWVFGWVFGCQMRDLHCAVII